MNRIPKLMVVLLVVTLVLAIPVAAQIGYGVKGGLNFANFSGANSDGYQWETGIVSGIFVKFDIGGNLAIQPEILYSQKGSSGTISTPGGTSKLDITMGYVEIPLLLRYTFTTNGSEEPFAYVGPSLGLLTKAEAVVEGNGQSATLDIANEKSKDVGLVFGGGVEIPIGVYNLVIEGRATIGMSKQFDDVEPFDRDDVFFYDLDFPMAEENGNAWELKNKAFALMVGIAF